MTGFASNQRVLWPSKTDVEKNACGIWFVAFSLLGFLTELNYESVPSLVGCDLESIFTAGVRVNDISLSLPGLHIPAIIARNHGLLITVLGKSQLSWQGEWIVCNMNSQDLVLQDGCCYD